MRCRPQLIPAMYHIYLCNETDSENINHIDLWYIVTKWMLLLMNEAIGIHSSLLSLKQSLLIDSLWQPLSITKNSNKPDGKERKANTPTYAHIQPYMSIANIVNTAGPFTLNPWPLRLSFPHSVHNKWENFALQYSCTGRSTGLFFRKLRWKDEIDVKYHWHAYSWERKGR